MNWMKDQQLIVFLLEIIRKKKRTKWKAVSEKTKCKLVLFYVAWNVHAKEKGKDTWKWYEMYLLIAHALYPASHFI